MTDVLPSQALGARASGAYGAGTSAGGRSQEQAPAPGGIHGRPGQMIEPNVYPIRKLWITRLPSPLPPGYAQPIPGVNHVRISGHDRYWCCFERLAQWQCAAPAVVSRAEWVALHAPHVRVAQFGVRQPCCRASRTHDPARGIPLPILVTGMLDVLVSIIESVRHACDTCA